MRKFNILQMFDFDLNNSNHVKRNLNFFDTFIKPRVSSWCTTTFSSSSSSTTSSPSSTASCWRSTPSTGRGLKFSVSTREVTWRKFLSTFWSGSMSNRRGTFYHNCRVCVSSSHFSFLLSITNNWRPLTRDLAGGDAVVEHVHLPPLPGQDRSQINFLHSRQGLTTFL